MFQAAIAVAASPSQQKVDAGDDCPELEAVK